MRCTTSTQATICIAFQAISRQGLPVATVGAGLPDLQVRLMAAKPYADRLFRYDELGRLSDAVARTALITPAATRGVGYDEGARAVLVDQYRIGLPGRLGCSSLVATRVPRSVG